MVDINENTTQNLTKTADDLVIFSPHELSNIEKGVLSEKFWRVINNGSPKSEDVFAVLYDYFAENEFSRYVIEKYYDTYWPIFVRLGWQLLPGLQDNIFTNVVARTLPYAVSEHINIKDKLLTELFLMDPSIAQSLYVNIKKMITSLDYPVSFNDEGKKIVMSNLIKQFSKQQGMKDLSRFDMFAQVQRALFPDIENDAGEVKKIAVQSIKDFLEILAFFVGEIMDVSEYAGDYYRNRPENKDLEMDKGLLGELGANLLEEYVSIEEGSEIEETSSLANELNLNFLAELSKHKTDFSGWINKATTLRSLLLWLGTFKDKTQARKEFVKNLQNTLGSDGLKNTDFVLAIAHLDEFLAKNNYRGDDFFHFDESSGNFKWGK